MQRGEILNKSEPVEKKINVKKSVSIFLDIPQHFQSANHYIYITYSEIQLKLKMTV